jgi:hypothetical protein
VEADFHDYDLTGFDGSRHFRRTLSRNQKLEIKIKDHAVSQITSPEQSMAKSSPDALEQHA